MPELFGVFGREPFGERESEAVEAMERELQGLGPGRVSSAELADGRVGVMSRHGFDYVKIERVDDPPLTVAWVGTPPQRSGRTVADVARAVVADRAEALGDMEPRWACVIGSERDRTWWIVSDRHGLCPLYYARVGTGLAVATKVAPLVRSGLVPYRLDPVALIDLVTFEHVTGDRTLVEDVKLVPAAAVLRLRNGHLRSSSSWASPTLPGREDGGARVTAADLYEGLRAGVQAAVSGAGASSKLAVTLSGGLDSRAVLGAAIGCGARPTTFTFGQPGCRDMRFARLAADAAGVDHVEVPIDDAFLCAWLDHAIAVTGGTVGAVHFQIMSLAKALAGATHVVLDGMGGDALTGAHLKPGMLLGRGLDRAVDAIYRQRATAAATPAERAAVLAPELLAEARYDPREAVWRHMALERRGAEWRGCHRFDLFERQRRFVQLGTQLLQPLLGVETPFYATSFYDRAIRMTRWQLAEQRLYLEMHARHLGPLAKVADAARGLPLTTPQPLRLAKKLLDVAGRRVGVSRWRRPEPATTDYETWLRQQAALVSERWPREVEALSPRVRLDGGELAGVVADPGRRLALLGALLAIGAWDRLARSPAGAQAPRARGGDRKKRRRARA